MPEPERGSVKAVIGKGGRGEALRPESVRHTACYLAALGGAGALTSRSVRQARVVAFEELGPEAIFELVLEDFPAWVVNDCYGADHYATVAEPWRKASETGTSQASSELGGG